MMRFDFACKRCEKQFILWSDDGKVCPHCGSKRIMKIFITAPAFSTGIGAAADKLAEQQLDAAGLSNVTNYGGQIVRTRKTDPKAIEAERVAKANNIPIVTAPAGKVATTPALRQQIPLARQLMARGKAHITHAPKGQGAMVANLMETGRTIDPLGRRSERILPADKGASDSATLKNLLGR